MGIKGGFLSLERLKLDNLYTTYLGMTAREQTMALVVAGVVAFLVIVIPLVVASRTLSSLQHEITSGQENFRSIVHEVEQYNSLKAELDALELELAGGFDSSIATTLEGLATQYGIREKIDALKEKALQPSDLFEQAAVDVRLKKVSLEDLVAFLAAIEGEPTKILKLESLDVKPRFDNKQHLDASLTVSTFRLQTAGNE